MSQLWMRSAGELAAGIARKEFSSAEVVEAHLQRIEAVNPGLNAIVRVLAEEARRASAEADRKVAAGERLGPLHGVPFTIKENIDLAGSPTTWGVKALAEAVAPSDAPVCPTWACACTPTAPCTASPAIRGTQAGRAAARAAARPSRWRQACLRSGSATTSAARCATRLTPAESHPFARRRGACPGPG